MVVKVNDRQSSKGQLQGLLSRCTLVHLGAPDMCNLGRVNFDPHSCPHHNLTTTYLQALGPFDMASLMQALSIPYQFEVYAFG